MDDLNDLEDFRAAATAWVAANAREAPPDYGAILPPDMVDAGVAWQQRLFAEGWAGIHWPTEYGGRGLTPAHQSIWLEVCALAEVPPFINMVGFVLAGQGCQVYGTDAQKAEHLRPIITAERLWCQLFSEPEAGSDLASLRTTAVRDGDEYVVNGQKVWCSGGRYSDWGILMARTDPDLPKHKGISFFVVDMHSRRHRDPAAAPDDRRGRVRRGLLHRRAHAGRPRCSGPRTAAGAWACRSSPTSGARSAPRPSARSVASMRSPLSAATTSTCTRANVSPSC